MKNATTTNTIESTKGKRESVGMLTDQAIQVAVGATMTSREIANLCEKEHKNVLADVRSMLDQLGMRWAEFSAQYKDGSGRSLPCFNLPKDLTLTLVSGYNVVLRKRIIDRWLELESRTLAPAALSVGEMFLQSAQLLVAIESRATKMEQAQAELSVRLDAVADTAALKKCPANAEPISHIRKRISKLFGLPVHIIDTAMRQLPYSPKPAGMVLNAHEGAQGSHYAVYWTKDVTALFKLFVSECKHETTTFVTHPFIECRFKLGAGMESKS